MPVDKMRKALWHLACFYYHFISKTLCASYHEPDEHLFPAKAKTLAVEPVVQKVSFWQKWRGVSTKQLTGEGMFDIRMVCYLKATKQEALDLGLWDSLEESFQTQLEYPFIWNFFGLYYTVPAPCFGSGSMPSHILPPSLPLPPPTWTVAAWRADSNHSSL
jgi:hypothetical protein